MPYASRPYHDVKIHISERLIEALGENMHRMEDYLGSRQKHSRNMEYCALRKLGRDIFPYQDPDGQYAELMKLLKESEGDPAELERYKSLEGYPAGSLGRTYWEFYAQFDWPLPGDPLWISEDLTVRHDPRSRSRQLRHLGERRVFGCGVYRWQFRAVQLDDRHAGFYPTIRFHRRRIPRERLHLGVSSRPECHSQFCGYMGFLAGASAPGR
jgi:hypothetical protein